MINKNSALGSLVTFGDYLGQVVDSRFSDIDALIPQGLPDTRQHDLSKGQFLVAARCTDRLHLVGQPTPAQLDLSALHLLRVQETRSEMGQGSVGKLCDALIKSHQDKATEPRSDLLFNFFQLVRCDVVGTFSADQNSSDIYYSADVDLLAPSVSYHVFSPDQTVMELLINGMVNANNRIEFGLLRFGEGKSYLKDQLPAYISMDDIRGKRTAMFGKTRMGKSNIVKLIVQGMLDATKDSLNVGQLIFDVNGEYANTNPQDGNLAIGIQYADRCKNYFLSSRGNNVNGKLLRFNFYEQSDSAFQIMSELLPPEVAQNEYVRTLLSCRLPAIHRQPGETDAQMNRKLRKIMLYWTLLDSAGLISDPMRLDNLIRRHGVIFPFNPNFSHSLRMAAYHAICNTPPVTAPSSFATMVIEITVIATFFKQYGNDPNLVRDGHPVFDGDEEIMINFLLPPVGTGPYVLRPCLDYHSPSADNFIEDTLSTLHAGGTVIVDLGSANERIIRYFAKTLSEAVFRDQERKFVSNQLNGKYVQIYFEEAHMIFPPNSGQVIDVYSRFAKEGAKFNIGIVYSTQSPSTINHDLLVQTENYFIGHLSSEVETNKLASVQSAFRDLGLRIMSQRTPGLVHLLTASHRYVIPVQANRYDGKSRLEIAASV